MQQLCLREQCTGCAACANICPKSCIKMEPDEEGFLYPQIDKDSCIACKRCSSVCPILANLQDKSAEEPAAYAAHNLDKTVVGSSSSGGVFTALARNILDKGGVVYGAAFQEDFSVAHLRVEKANEIHRFQGSKYAQSNPGRIYLQVRDDLNAGRKVLFSGTPCQVAALRSCLGRNYEELLCVDIICHSVPSPYVWQKYLRQIEMKSDKKVEFVSFRDKRDGWKDYYLCTRLSDGTEELRRGAENYYMTAFLQGLSTRPSCYNCKFKGQNRNSAITLGDFWGVETACPKAYYEKGTSLVLIQNEMGQLAFQEIMPQLEVIQVDALEALKGNPAYSNSSKAHEKRAVFFAKLDSTPVEKLVVELMMPTPKERLYQWWTRCIINRGIRKIKRLL